MGRFFYSPSPAVNGKRGNVQHTNKRFNETEKTILERMKGSTLLSVDTVLAAPPNDSWNTVRLHFENFDVDINNHLNDISVDEVGTLEEFGLLSITKAAKEMLDLPEVGTDTTVIEVNKKIIGVTVINDIADIYGNGKLVARLEYPQAIALHTKTGIIMLDKEVWFSETIALKMGENIDTLLYDESVNWEDDPEEDPTTHFDFRTEAQSL